MPTFEEALRINIKGPSENFRSADSDLHQEVLEASQATEKVTDGAYRLTLAPVSSIGNGVTYGLVLEETRNGTGVDINVFHVPYRGYPIRVAGTRLSQAKDLASWQSLPTRAAIRDYLTEQAANPDSELVTRIALQSSVADA